MQQIAAKVCEGDKTLDRVSALRFRQHAVERVKRQRQRLCVSTEHIQPGITVARITHPAADQNAALNSKRRLDGAESCGLSKRTMPPGRHRFAQLQVAHSRTRCCGPSAELGDDVVSQLG